MKNRFQNLPFKFQPAALHDGALIGTGASELHPDTLGRGWI
jgi:hypothetical protein